MRVLVTGARGFIGRAVVGRLLAAGAAVHGLSRQTQPQRAGLHWHTGDVLDTRSRQAALREAQPTHLIHLAWTTAPGRYWDDPANDAWTAASMALLLEFAGQGGQHAFVAGSCAEYDWQGGAIEEGRTPLWPTSRYGRCKAELGQQALQRMEALGVPLAWGRIHFPFGPGEPMQRLVPSITLSLLAGETAATGPAEVARDFIYVDDLADAIALLVQRKHPGALDLCTGSSREIGELARCIAKTLGRCELLRLGSLPARAGDPLRLSAEPHTLRGLGWQPLVGFEEGLRRCVDWWRVHQHEGAQA